jgi:hypothetical protein
MKKQLDNAAWTQQSLEDMSPLVRQKAEAWLKADAAAADAKKVFKDVASMAARKAKVIGPDQYLAYSNNYGQLAYTVKSSSGLKKQTVSGPKF